MAKQPQIEFRLQPKQIQLLDLVLNSPYTRIGYGGANGGSKSHAIRDINMWICNQKAGIKTLIFRRLRNDLLENHIDPFFLKYPFFKRYFNKTESIIRWPNGSTTKFGYAEREEDITDFEGKEYDYIFMDEATLCTQYMVEFLQTRNRSGKVRAKMIFTMIPGFVGHSYFKRLFITKRYEDYEDSEAYVYLPARVWDNVVWSERALKERGFTAHQYYYEWTESQRREFTLNHSDYAKTLLHLPEQKKKARLFGSWDIFEGQFFEDWNPDVHVIRKENYLDYTQLRQFEILGGLDYGNITVLYLAAKDYHGNVIVFDELYFDNVSRETKIQKTKEFLSIRNMYNTGIIADTNMWVPDAFDKAEQLSPAMEYMKRDHKSPGLKLIKVSKTSPNNKRYRIACNDAVKDGLSYIMDDKTGIILKQPKFKVYERCVHFIETFPALVVSQIDPEDIEKDQPDHCYDGFKYLYMSLKKPVEKPEEREPDWYKKHFSKKRKKRTKMGTERTNNFMAA